MLSYQHIYHAGNAADLHKHALLAWMLDYLTAKDKPLSYLETHAGRGLYDLSSPEARKTAEADAGILRAERADWLSEDHPLMRALASLRRQYGDSAHLAEMHPAEHDALAQVSRHAKLYRQDGFQMAQAVTPPTPRRGLMLVDPSYEVKTDYTEIPAFFQDIARKWNVGTLALWYPILTDDRQRGMVTRLSQAFPEALKSEVHFPPAKPGHGMVGSGMFVVNPPWGLAEEARRIEALFRA